VRSIRLLPNHTYVHPSGYKVKVVRHPSVAKWRLVGTLAEPTFCHKPSTVSGGGKSEISKSLTDAVLYGPIFIGEYDSDMDLVEQIINRDYSDCILDAYKPYNSDPARPILSMERTLGSVIKLLTRKFRKCFPFAILCKGSAHSHYIFVSLFYTADDIFTPKHNEFVDNIPNHIRAIIFAIKSNYRPEMGKNWRSYFTVDMSNGVPGHELKFKHRQLVGSYLRVGLWKNGTWRNFKMRQDFIPVRT